jgi:peptidoglycan/xylan/chitin deacetylase (PgdA/CDA1 family)
VTTLSPKLSAGDVEMRHPSVSQQWDLPSFKRSVRQRVLSACHVIDRLPDGRGLLLTFDDGPNPEVTPHILDLLGEYGARAIFFVIGDRAERNSKLLKRIVDEGHVVGNHTYRHPLRAPKSLRFYYRELSRCQSIVEYHTGCRPNLFRPPFGSLSLSSLFVPRCVGLRTVLWSIDAGDWQVKRIEDATAAGLRFAEAASAGDIVLLHDDNPFVAGVLESALPRFRQRKLNFSGDVAQAILHPDGNEGAS